MNPKLWKRLEREADEEVAAVLRRLPAAVHESVREIPIVFEAYPSDDMVEDGVEPDLLGLFVGDAYAEDGQHPALRQIYLFLLNIWDDAAEDPAEYRTQVRQTLLHEIGHYLGLEEEDLEERGLE